MEPLFNIFCIGSTTTRLCGIFGFVLFKVILNLGIFLEECSLMLISAIQTGGEIQTDGLKDQEVVRPVEHQLFTEIRSQEEKSLIQLEDRSGT